ncbi:hypothetical protein G4V62_02860 [Bacillaceae bacterium SIJ1]|uniref:hypothetical protein n=1 Tax=Litoribacterium kuwaitense TaxID=1398745 RepID=UPI0013E9DFF8|nr:hypothetical protein [Litoribacterium kuwaitense]NGP43940.1 hypothetical protein [Litoribacterium kuwaitense]
MADRLSQIEEELRWLRKQVYLLGNEIPSSRRIHAIIEQVAANAEGLHTKN